MKQTLREHAGRFTRYSIGSVVAFATSQLVFYVLYSLGAGARASSIVAMLAGVPPAYHLNRRWAFGKSGSSSLKEEVLPYLGIVAVNVFIATVGTEVAEGWIAAQIEPGWQRSLLVTGAFAAINGALFVGKYLIFDRWLFARERGSPESERSPVP
ncbi:MAG: GtrA family protein [Nitriliruptorales bacterium]|nr:GtrA family protein [Nitriliruptorales bacterium]